MNALPRQCLFTGLLLLGTLAIASGTAEARGGGGGGSGGGFHGGGVSGGMHSGIGGQIHSPSIGSALSRGPTSFAPMAVPGGRAIGPQMGGGGSTLLRSTPAQPQMGSGHQGHQRPPMGSSGSNNAPGGSRNTLRNSAVLGGALSGAVTNQATQTQVPSPALSTGPNPGLTGGTDPAIGQPSPPIPEVFASSGGPATVDHSGGGAETLASCMSFWEPATHMSKPEWRATCQRTLNGIDLPVDTAEMPATTRTAHGQHRQGRVIPSRSTP